MKAAAEMRAHLLHTSEASLSGYAGSDFKTFEDYDWELLRSETTTLHALARDLKMVRDDEIMSWGTPSNHPRQYNGQAEP